ncbi:HAMP domain-containing histidine kinase [Hazenella sp. IB182357]|uniref:histidine kinase n=1 Tax=Polycladospora coralii TaxID=2771432 RepID=A0A926N7U7_9BACL|nr:HAMP domain-containing sensor histidine kinase [Polycladospora coralii]MBD1371676.1 HAMP domain-containing histidine kinase [Polycladospora coralii]MBS7529143.1 HAMP domain-containing histidine kinase [Polycladospora coralii]
MEKLTTRLQIAEQEREQLEKYRQGWVAGISHDLKTPLAYIKGYATMMSVDTYQWSKEEIAEFNKLIEQKANEIENLITDIRFYLNNEEVTMPLRLESVNVIEMIQDVIQSLSNRPSTISNQISFTSNYPRIQIKVDAHYLKRVLQNLIKNAIVHNTYQTSIKVSVEKLNQQIHILIEDDGRGIDEYIMNELNASKYPLSYPIPTNRRSGIGLLIAKQLMIVLGGSFNIESTKGKGTKISITLPN